MRTKTYLLIHSAIYAVFAVGLFAAPKLILELFAMNSNDQYVLFLVQDTSVFVAGIAVLGYLFRNIAERSDEARKLILAFMITAVFGFLLTVQAALKGILTGPLGWADALLFAVLIGLAYGQLAKNRV